MKQTYSDLLKDPRWQKKRLEILQRDEFKCRSCTDDLSTLHVHHWFYDPDLLPWEYNENDLITLCETCHNAITALDKLLKHSDFGMETVICVVRLLDKLESDSIEEFLNSIKTIGNE